jgi:hypothetical protein
MAFIRRKRVGGSVYHMVVRSRRVEGTVKQEVLAYLGTHPTIGAALAAVEAEMRWHDETYRHDSSEWVPHRAQKLRERRRVLRTLQQDTGLP